MGFALRCKKYEVYQYPEPPAMHYLRQQVIHDYNVKAINNQLRLMQLVIVVAFIVALFWR